MQIMDNGGGGGGGRDVQHMDVLFGGVLYVGVCIYVGMS